MEERGTLYRALAQLQYPISSSGQADALSKSDANRIRWGRLSPFLVLFAVFLVWFPVWINYPHSLAAKVLTWLFIACWGVIALLRFLGILGTLIFLIVKIGQFFIAVWETLTDKIRDARQP